MPLDQDPHDYPTEKEMSFLDHLEELRWHVVRSAFAIMFFMIAAFIFTKEIFDYIIFAPAKVNFPTFKWLCKLGEFFGMAD
jgi:sec-independent protein translocase protein TatC